MNLYQCNVLKKYPNEWWCIYDNCISPSKNSIIYIQFELPYANSINYIQFELPYAY